MTENENEEELFHPNFEAEQNFLNELEERSQLGLLDTLEDTHVAFRTLLEQDIFCLSIFCLSIFCLQVR
jgi:hypothetical protein